MKARNDLCVVFRVLHIDHRGGRYFQPSQPVLDIPSFGRNFNAGEMGLAVGVSEDPCDVKADIQNRNSRCLRSTTRKRIAVSKASGEHV
jgi:hypothetical protein